jgi:hypothetical protein
LEGILFATGKAAMSGPLAELTNREEGPSRAGDAEFVKPSSSVKGNEGGMEEDGMMDEDELSRLEAMEASQFLEEAEDEQLEHELLDELQEEAEDKGSSAATLAAAAAADAAAAAAAAAGGDGVERTKRPADGVLEQQVLEQVIQLQQEAKDKGAAAGDGAERTERPAEVVSEQLVLEQVIQQEAKDKGAAAGNPPGPVGMEWLIKNGYHDGAERTKRPTEGVSEEGAGDGAASKRQRVPTRADMNLRGLPSSDPPCKRQTAEELGWVTTTDVEVTTTGGRRITFKRRSPDEHAPLEVRRGHAHVPVVLLLNLRKRRTV